MPCCGKARTQLQPVKVSPKTKAANAPASHLQPSAGQNVLFRYHGQTGLTVTGPASSRIYRFSANTAPIAVDARDAASLSRVPNLRMVRNG